MWTNSALGTWRSASFLLDLLEDLAAAVLEQVEYVLESLLATVVRVGDFGIGILDAEVAETLDLVSVLRGREAFEIREVFVVHGEDQIECVYVVRGDFSGGSGHGEAALAAGDAHARIGGIAGVVADRAGRVALYGGAESGFLEKLAHDVFARGRAADVTHADEEDG